MNIKSYISGYMLLGVLLGAAGPSPAQTSGFDILKFGPNAHAMSINEAGTAVLLGPSDLYMNPANLALEPSSALSADYTLWIADQNLSHVAVNFKREQSAIAFGIISSAGDDFEFREQPGPSQGTFSFTYLSLAGAYAYRVGRFSAGLAAQYLFEEAYIYRASGYAFNAGVSAEWWDDRLRTGITLSNLGRMNDLNNRATPLPTRLKGGFSLYLFEFSSPGDDNFPIGVTLMADYVYPIEDADLQDTSYDPTESFVNAGLAFDVAELIHLYAGYKSGDTERPLSAGAGVDFEAISFNYGLVPFSTGYGTVHSIGIRYRF